jgi:hypothetical protein
LPAGVQTEVAFDLSTLISAYILHDNFLRFNRNYFLQIVAYPYREESWCKIATGGFHGYLLLLLHLLGVQHRDRPLWRLLGALH